VLVSVRESLLVCYPELRGVRYSEVQFVLVIYICLYIGRSAGAKARRPLDGGVHYLECPL
jgi:hypothetical protein